MGKTATTWELMKASWHVLMRDKALLVFPVVSGVACFLVLLTFVVPALGLGAAGQGNLFRGQGGVLGYVLLFCYYLCNFFVVFFFNAALVDFVVTRMHGGEPSIGASLRAAATCMPQIAAWAVVSSTVGVVLKALEGRAGLLGRLVVSLVGVAWTLVTYFVVPIIVAAIAGVAISQGHYAGGWGTLAIAAVLYLVALTIVLSALRAIFGVVLYMFAKTCSAPEGFDAAALRGAIQPA